MAIFLPDNIDGQPEDPSPSACSLGPEFHVIFQKFFIDIFKPTSILVDMHFFRNCYKFRFNLNLTL